jgi:hypothetical protein
MDDIARGTIDGMPAYAWVTRCYYPDSQTALAAAHRAVPMLKALYVIESPVYKGFEQYWPNPTYWQVRTKEPFGGVQGAFYIGKPNFYVVTEFIDVYNPSESINLTGGSKTP